MAGEIYLCHANESEARAQGAALGISFPPDGTIPSGNGNYSLFAPMQAPWATKPVYAEDGDVVTPGVLESGFWSMLWLDPEWAGYDATIAAIEAAGVRRYPVEPPVVWA